MFSVCCIFVEGNKSAPKNAYLSRAEVKQLLVQHPRSPWWINNCRLADFCGIQHDGDVHNTMILGKYIPRGKVSWDREPGLYFKIQFSEDNGMTLAVDWLDVWAFVWLIG